MGCISGELLVLADYEIDEAVECILALYGKEKPCCRGGSCIGGPRKPLCSSSF